MYKLLILISLFWFSTAIAQEPSHTVWNNLLSKHVTKEGWVNYKGFQKDSIKLKAYIKTLATDTPTDQWTEDATKAYWMNVYNALTIDLILKNLPLSSIKDIKNPWGKARWVLNGKKYSLNDIEHRILRKMGDPRIHFGINCASFSCPKLPKKAFTATNVNTYLEALAKAFINDPLRNTINKDSVAVSKIFQWFGGDFKTNGSLLDYLNMYLDKPLPPQTKIDFLDYNWALNKPQ